MVRVIVLRRFTLDKIPATALRIKFQPGTTVTGNAVSMNGRRPVRRAFAAASCFMEPSGRLATPAHFMQRKGKSSAGLCWPRTITVT